MFLCYSSLATLHHDDNHRMAILKWSITAFMMHIVWQKTFVCVCVRVLVMINFKMQRNY